MKRAVTIGIYLLSGLIGVVAFTYPFFLPQLAGLSDSGQAAVGAHQVDAPLLTMVLIVLCLGVLLVEVQGQAVSAKVVAALGVLVSITAVLRLAEVVFPGLGGFSFMFAPIILGGYVFGARFGFLLGTMALLGSALLTGGVGPWLPYQMFAAGWVGLTAGWLPHFKRPSWQLALLMVFGLVWGLLFGAIMNLYFWPFIADGGATSWQSGLSAWEGVRRYAVFYAATSLVWDVGRSLGNVLLLAALGLPVMKALIRFRDRFQFARL